MVTPQATILELFGESCVGEVDPEVGKREPALGVPQNEIEALGSVSTRQLRVVEEI